MSVTDEVRALAGPFELTNAESTRRCAVTLEARAHGAGFALTFDRPACSAALSFLSTVTAWSIGPSSSIRLLDTGGRVVAEFGETEVGLYEMARSGEGIFFLSNHGGSEPAGPTLADLVGTWNFSRQAGRTICKVTLTDQPSGDDGFRLALAAGCDQTITAFAPVSWRLERSDFILVSSRGDRLRFERSEGATWRKVPEAGRPLLMNR